MAGMPHRQLPYLTAGSHRERYNWGMRKWLLIPLVLAALGAQVKAYSCERMDVTMVAQCCCAAGQPCMSGGGSCNDRVQSSSGSPCCSQVSGAAVAYTADAWNISGKKAKLGVPHQPVTLAGSRAVPLIPISRALLQSGVRSTAHSGRMLYLETARLRI